MINESDINLETVGKESYERLKKAWVGDSPYGKELANNLLNFVIKKMTESVNKRKNWLTDDLKLSIAKKGLFDFEGQPLILAIRLLSQASQYGADDYIPILRTAVSAMEEDGQEVPQNFRSDIQLTRNWVNAKFGSNI